MSDDNDYTVVILDCSLDLVVKKKCSDCVGMSAQVNMKALQWESGDTYSIKLYLFSADLQFFQNMDIDDPDKIKKKEKQWYH